MFDVDPASSGSHVTDSLNNRFSMVKEDGIVKAQTYHNQLQNY